MMGTMSLRQPENWLYEIWQKGYDSPCYVMVPNAKVCITRKNPSYLRLERKTPTPKVYLVSRCNFIDFFVFFGWPCEAARVLVAFQCQKVFEAKTKIENLSLVIIIQLKNYFLLKCKKGIQKTESFVLFSNKGIEGIT